MLSEGFADGDWLGDMLTEGFAEGINDGRLDEDAVGPEEGLSDGVKVLALISDNEGMFDCDGVEEGVIKDG